jgi:hypothetical protein
MKELQQRFRTKPLELRSWEFDTNIRLGNLLPACAAVLILDAAESAGTDSTVSELVIIGKRNMKQI